LYQKSEILDESKDTIDFIIEGCQFRNGKSS
jgi:hypothetical protein